MGYTSETDSENSSFRAVFLAAAIIWVIQFILFNIVFFIEIQKPEINYNGLALIYGVLVGEIFLLLFTKAINKYFEVQKKS